MRNTWEGAPDWAQWKAIDDDGQEWWFEERPQLVEITQGNCWVSVNGRKELRRFDGRNSLEERPSPSQSFLRFDGAPSWVNFGAIDMQGRAFWLQYQPEFGQIDKCFGRSKHVLTLPKLPTNEIIFKRPKT